MSLARVYDEVPAEATWRARELNFARAERRRKTEREDALHYLHHGDDAHRDDCVFAQEDGGEACSRDYDPFPYYDAAPEPAALYAHTGVGALYGLPGWERHVWQLAGWNVPIREGDPCAT